MTARTENTGCVTLRDLAMEIGMDRSNARKYILAAGFEFIRIRTKEAHNQLTLALVKEDAETVLQLREDGGFGPLQKPVEFNSGFFYIIQIVPDLDPLRIKLGFTTDTQTRLSTYRTVSPTATLLKAWPCKRQWEHTAIESITREGCTEISNEVFSAKDPKRTVVLGDNFFKIMPPLNKDTR